VIASGALLAAAGLALLHQASVHGSYLPDILPGLILVALGLGPVFVSVTAAANEGVSPDRAGIVAALLNAAQQVGAALGLAILSALASSRAHHLLATGTRPDVSATAGYDRALLAAAAFMVLAAAIGLTTTNTRENPMEAPLAAAQEPELTSASAVTPT